MHIHRKHEFAAGETIVQLKMWSVFVYRARGVQKEKSVSRGDGEFTMRVYSQKEVLSHTE